MIGILGVIITFGLIIFIHEFGHFLVAKLRGIKVENFSFGMGKEICGFSWGETRYSLRMILFGGMVKLAGEYPEERAANPREFYGQPWYIRSLVVSAGPLMNYILAWVIFTLVIIFWGLPHYSSEPVIGGLIPGMPAESAGLEPGDRILAVNQEEVTTWEGLSQAIRRQPSGEILLRLKRVSGLEEELRIIPAQKGRELLIGIAPGSENVPVSKREAFVRGFQQVIFWTVFPLNYLAEQIRKREKPDLAGPVGIAQVVARATQRGWSDFLYLIGMISTGIGMFNLFPIPLLDGGHILIFAIEGIRRRPLTPRAVSVVNFFGLSILILIFVFATFNDLERIWHR